MHHFRIKIRTVAFLTGLALVTLFVFGIGCDKIESLTGTTAIKGPNVKILFAGDTSFGENYRGSPELLKKKGYNFPMRKIAPLLKTADFIIFNLETPITDIEISPYKDEKAYCHWTHVDKAPKAFLKHGMTTFSLANNHGLDFGVPGLKQTIEIAQKNGMNVFGAGMTEADANKPFVKTFTVGKHSFKIAVIGAFEYSRSYDAKYSFYADGEAPGVYKLSTDAVKEQIAGIRSSDPDTFVIVYPHWGKNYKWKTKRQTKYAHRMMKDGADLIIGHGGHSMQEIERYQGKWIVYGLGNFMFLSPGRYSKLETKPFSYTAQLIVIENGDKLEKRIRLHPIFSNNKKSKYQVRPLTDEEFVEFHQLLLEKSPLTKKERKRIRKGKDKGGNFVEFRL